MDFHVNSKRPTINLDHSQTGIYDKLSNCRYSYRSNSTDSTPLILPLFQQLQSKLNEFDEFIFPPLELPSAKHKKVIKRRLKKIEKEEKVEALQPVYFSSRFKEVEKPHILSATATFNTTRFNIGPGTYESSPKNDQKGIFLSGTPRFEGFEVKAAEDFIEQKSRNYLCQTMIKKNKDMAKHTKERRLQSLEETTKIRDFESLVHKRTKIALESLNRETKLKNYTEKISKFEWRMKRFEIHKVKIGWGCLITVASTIFIFNLKVKLKKHAIKRINKMFMILYWVSKAVGKIAIKLKRIRWNYLIKTVNKRSPLIRNWIEKRKKIYNKMIVALIERVLFGNYMTRLMVNFKKYIYLIQYSIRHIIRIKRARNWGLMLLFKKLETKVLERKGQKRSFKDHTFAPAMIEVEIRKYYLKAARKYMMDVKAYKEKIKEEHGSSRGSEYDQKFRGSYNETLKKPVFLLYTSTEEIVKDIKLALGIEVKNSSSPNRRATTKVAYGRKLTFNK
ncbi:hypothetical protein SteCoe_19321 [Stentor coeruleus]|uniref:Uncharacterized protein n=1 Tax=Stentor coeruleus TaxID=5963 RepID=A0A1R2BUE1_9CILI|nr:hypothetical protein SteCoe_19321 [Stentor coeruleus]